MLTDTKLKKALGKKRDDIEVLSDSHGLNVRISQLEKSPSSIATAGKVNQ
ncbi:hypothetical protein [Klebsiella pneumoniae]|nr:hypothetical protein [Klebsiella pneumoniae]